MTSRPCCRPTVPGLALVSDTTGGRLWRWRRGSVISLPVRVRRFESLSAEFSQDGALVATWTGSGRARAWDARTGKRSFITPKARDHPITLAVPSADGSRLLTVDETAATIWSVPSGTSLASLVGHSGLINEAVFSPDGRRVATASADGTARVWNATSGQQLSELRGHSASVTDVAFSPDGRFLLSTGDDGTARFWELTPGAVFGSRSHIVAAAFGPGGSR